MSDTRIIYGGILFFISLALIMSFVSDKMHSNFSKPDYDSLQNDISSNIPDSNISAALTTWRFFINVLKASLWTFGSIPWLVDLLFLLPIRIVFWFTCIRQIAGSGA